VVFGVTFGVLQLLTTLSGPGFRTPILQMLARMTSWLATALGMSSQAAGSTVSNGSYALEVIWQCSGATPMAVFVAAVAAFPASWRSKILGWVVGLALLFVANLLRILTLLYVGAEHPMSFETVHLRVWQPLLILLTVVLWLAWVMRFVPREESRAA
jgi:exosortase H (IPTLxxWG-CTERM-specific)